MTSRRELLDKLLRGTSDADIPFSQLCALLRSLGFEERIKGSHYIFFKIAIPEIINLQPKGSKAKPYQARQVRSIILNYKLAGGEDE